MSDTRSLAIFHQMTYSSVGGSQEDRTERYHVIIVTMVEAISFYPLINAVSWLFICHSQLNKAITSQTNVAAAIKTLNHNDLNVLLDCFDIYLVSVGNMGDRFEKLGFHPQKELIYNNLLVYSDEIDEESLKYLVDIKTNLGKAILCRNLRDISFWMTHLIK